jgi:tryptophan halogenase
MKVTIIGGGTAGWLSALFFQKYGNHTITVIDSSRVGILGAGEASTPNLQGLLYNLGIGERDFLEKTNATMKFANEFTNWSPYGGMYSHGFEGPGMTEFQKKLMHGFHFDARECAKYFKEIGSKRGISHLDVNIINFTQNNDGDITTIHTEEGIDVETDFVIDCSGFARLGTGKLYNSEWVSYSKYLKANSAIAYFLPQESGITATSKTYTQSIAMKNGWMWQAPLQHRWGCGYVFNDEYISIDEAKSEIEEYIGREIDIVKTFKYEPGSYKTTWNNNCVSLGLASGFLEPLEGTSLMTLIFSIYKLSSLALDNFKNKNIVDVYNKYVVDINHQCMLFVRHHYNCNRTDTKYWSDITNSELPIELTNILNNMDTIKNNDELIRFINPESKSPVFGIYNYQLVDLGHKFKTQKTLF